MVATTIVFSAQDVLSRHLAETHSVMMVVMIRFWAFAAFVTLLAARSPGGLRAAVHTRFPLVQALRGVLLVVEVCVMVVAFVKLGLIESHAVFTCYPLLVAALSGPVLGEKVGWRRWAAVGVGFIGILVIVRPGTEAFQPASLICLAGALSAALYSITTRKLAGVDSASTQQVYSGLIALACVTPFAFNGWVWPNDGAGWFAFIAAGIAGMIAHQLNTIAHRYAPPSALAPFSYSELILLAFASWLVFNEPPDAWFYLGAPIIIGSGIYIWLRERKLNRPVTVEPVED